jgi:hypothetical protein
VKAGILAETNGVPAKPVQPVEPIMHLAALVFLDVKAERQRLTALYVNGTQIQRFHMGTTWAGVSAAEAAVMDAHIVISQMESENSSQLDKKGGVNKIWQL